MDLPVPFAEFWSELILIRRGEQCSPVFLRFSSYFLVVTPQKMYRYDLNAHLKIRLPQANTISYPIYVHLTKIAECCIIN